MLRVLGVSDDVRHDSESFAGLGAMQRCHQVDDFSLVVAVSRSSSVLL